MTPETRRKLDRLLLMERLAKWRDAVLALASLAAILLGALYFRAHPVLHGRIALTVAAAEGLGVLAAIFMTLLGYRKPAIWLIFGSTKLAQNGAVRVWARRRRPPPIAKIAPTEVRSEVAWRLEPAKRDEGVNWPGS